MTDGSQFKTNQLGVKGETLKLEIDPKSHLRGQVENKNS